MNSVDGMLAEIGKIALANDLSVMMAPWATFEWDVLNTAQAGIIGCDADFDAYESRRNPKVTAEQLGSVRTASCHVHVGFDEPADPVEKRLWIIKAMDYTIALPGIQQGGDTDAMVRRQFYGKAGAFRFKPYGVEYRTPDSSFLNEPDTTGRRSSPLLPRAWATFWLS